MLPVKLSVSLLLLLSLLASQASVDAGRPPTDLVDRMERLLERRRCIEPLSQWARYYTYGLNGEPTDRSRIVFSFRQPVAGETPGRTELEVLGDGPGRGAHGSYVPATGEIIVDYCGSSWPQTEDECRQMNALMERMRQAGGRGNIPPCVPVR